MDNHIFRNAPWGFNRQDVMEYIEKTQRDGEAAAAALTEQLNAARQELEALRQQVESGTSRSEELSARLEESVQKYEQECEEREAFELEAARQGEAVRALVEERDRLAGQVAELNRQSEDVRREKEKLAQLELDAHRRVDELLAQTREEAQEILAQAQSQADSLLRAADAQASDTLAQAQARRAALLEETQTQIESSARQCGELFDSCERITAHITNELRKLDVANAQLPIGLGRLKAGLAELTDKAKER